MVGRISGLGAAAVVVAGVALQSAYPLNHDAAWYLHCAGRWLDGARLYRDVGEVSPPPVIWLSAVPVAVAQATGWPVSMVFRAAVFVLIGASLAWAARIARGPLILAAAATLAILPGYDFGQREHLLIVLGLPYLLMRSSGGRTGAVAAGLAMGLGLALKPQFIVAWLGAEALARGRGRCRPAIVAAGTVVAVAWALTWALTPDYFALARRTTPIYLSYQVAGWQSLLIRPELLPILAAAIACALCRPAPPVALGSIAAMVGLAAVAVVNGKGWPYHYYPATAAALVALAACARPTTRGAMAGLVVALVLLSVVMGRWPTTRAPGAPYHANALQFVRGCDAPGPLAVLSPWFSTGWPLALESGRPWAMRYPALWFAPPTSKPSEGGRAMLAEALADVRAARPAVVLIDTRGSVEFGDLDLPGLYHESTPIGPLRAFIRGGD